MQHLINKLPFAHRSWFMYLRLLVRHFLDDDCTQKSSSLTYTTLLSLVPIITVMLVLFSVVPALSEVREQFQEAIYSNLLPSSSQSVQNYLDSFAEKSSNLGLVGILGVFITTIMTLLTIEEAFNKIWRVSDRSGGLTSIMRYWTMITLAPIVLGVTFGASSAISGLSFLNQNFMGYSIDWAVWAQIASFLVMMAGFIGMYWFIPKAQVPIKNAVIAGVVASILFETLKQIFGLVITNFTSYEAIYGAFAIIPVFLMWVYLSWNIILLGVEISYTLTIFDDEQVPVQHPLLSLLDMLHIVYQHHQQGKTVSEEQLRQVLGRKELPKWNLYITELMNSELIAHTKDNRYFLRTDLQTMTFWQFYRHLPYPLPIKDEMDKFKEAKADVWFDRLYKHLQTIEKTAKDELDMTMADLLQNTPLRQKTPVQSISTDGSAKTSDVDGFRDDANSTTDEQGNHIVLPETASTSPSKLTQVVNLAKHTFSWVKQGKIIVDRVKNLKK